MTDSEIKDEYEIMLHDLKDQKEKLACLENKKRRYF